LLIIALRIEKRWAVDIMIAEFPAQDSGFALKILLLILFSNSSLLGAKQKNI